MDMDQGLGTEEQLVGLSNNDATHIITKGKRTKRLRLLSPCGVAATTVITSSSSSASVGSFSSYESTNQEEEDMANCLILLAQGGGGGGGDGGGDSNLHHRKQLVQENDQFQGDGIKGSTKMATNSNSNTKVGFFIYECKTCNRTFPSFQALGGHRASHKKPKLMAEEKKPPLPQPPPSQPQLIITNHDLFEEAGKAQIKSGPPISLQLGNQRHKAFNGNKAKIHECSICGSEFTSGQALGGHMRRHRASTNTANETSCNNTTTVTATTAASAVIVQPAPRNILELDLNLPAPEDDLRESKFQSLVLSASPALVDCHY